MPNSQLATRLLKKYDEEVEHVGFIMARNKVVEVENKAENPAAGFVVSSEDILLYGDDAVATWHTHPKASSNLSTLDMETFLLWSNMDHYIIGNDGVTKYVVVNGDILIASDS